MKALVKLFTFNTQTLKLSTISCFHRQNLFEDKNVNDQVYFLLTKQRKFLQLYSYQKYYL